MSATVTATATATQPIVVFDVETQHTFEEVGGHDHIPELGISYVGVYAYSQQKLFGFWEKDLETLEKILLREHPLLVGFNSLHFDVPVLQPYFKHLDLSSLQHLDILRDVEQALGHRVKLDNIANATLNEQKSGSGLDAIRWYREGNFESLARYCLDDVRITRDVYEYGLRHGRLFYPSGGEKKPIRVHWTDEPTIMDRIRNAFKRHEQLTVEYFSVPITGSGKEIVKRTLDILDMDDRRIQAYCHELNDKDTFLIENVWSIRQTGQTSSHQGSLFG